MAIVRSSEYASAKLPFDDLYRRQEAVMAKLEPRGLQNRLRAAVDKVGSGGGRGRFAAVDVDKVGGLGEGGTCSCGQGGRLTDECVCCC